MLCTANPADLTADERLRAVAAILAAGVLRLRIRATLPSPPSEYLTPNILPESDQNCLEVSEETVLSVHVG
jgi:hypothetical protein